MTAPTTSGPGPLAGIRVVDLTRALSGPYATLMLADAGAEVIKVERPDGGDDARGWGPPFAGRGEDEVSTYFLSVNRSKRSVRLDLKDPGDLGRLRALIASADVLVENFRPGVMDRLGLDAATLEREHPRLVLLSITGFGEGGPDGHRSGFDQILQGEAGLMSITGEPGGPPMKFGVPITDVLAGMFGAYGVAAALREREISGRGQRVTTSLLASALAVHTHHGTQWTVAGSVPAQSSNRHPTIAPYGAFRCSDGWINVAVGSEGLWQRFAPLVGLEADRPEYATNRARVEHWDELEAAINGAMEVEPVEAWMVRLDRAGVPAGRIRTLDEVYVWPQVAHLGLVDRLDAPGIGPIAVAGSPVGWARSGRRPPDAPPRLGRDDAWFDGAIGADAPGPEGRPEDDPRQ